MVKGTFSYTNYEPEYVDEHFITLNFDTAYSPKTLIAQCTECTASDPFYNVVYFQDNNSFRWYCYAHNGEIRFCNDNVLLVQPSGALWYWETQDDKGDRWVLIDTSHVGVQGTDYLVYKAMWFTYAKGNNLVAVTDYSSATVPSWPPTHGGGHSFNDGYITPISSFGYDDTCTIDYLQCSFAEVGEEPTLGPSFGYDTYSFYVYSGSYGKYLLYDVKVHRSNTVKTPNLDNAVIYVRNLYQNYDDLTLIHNALIIRNGYSGGTYYSGFPTAELYIPVSDLDFEVNVYNTQQNYIGNFNYIRENYEPTTYTSVTINDGKNATIIRSLEANSGYILCVGSGLSSYSGFSKVGNTDEYYLGNGIEQYYYYNVNYDVSSVGFSFYSNNENYANTSAWRWAIEYMTGLTVMPEPSPTPTTEPDPNATSTPTPTPTPTEPPHVIIQWPTSTPSPTPPFVIPTIPPWNPPGNQIVPLDPDIQNNVFGVFKNKLGDNNAFGLIGLLIGLLPGDLMWYLWFLLFVLLVVGVAKLIIHFTGG